MSTTGILQRAQGPGGSRAGLMFRRCAPLVGAAWGVLLVLVVLLSAPRSARADGFIIVDPPRDRPTLSWRDVPMTVKYHRVEVTIVNQVATTHVDQVFVNQASFTVEGTYIFPLPEDAAISSFDMTVDGNKYEGKILDRDEARNIYEGIVRQQRDPALLEYVGRGVFQASIFPIPAGAERRIELTYVQVLEQDAGLVHYRYPLDIEKYSAQPIGEVQVRVRVEDKSPLRALYSPSHPLRLERDGERRATATYREVDVQPDRDLDLYYSVSSGAEEIAINLLSYKMSNEDGYFLLLVTPPVQAPSTPIPKDVVLVLDTSSSMEGDKIDQLRKAADYVLEHLSSDDRFNVISFSNTIRLFAEEPQPLSRLEEGRAFVAELQPQGSTDINRALLEGAAGASAERPTILIFLTDGLPTAGEKDPERIVENVKQNTASSVRLFGFGVGYDVDTNLLEQLSSGLRGASAYVRPDQAIDEEVSAFYAKVSTPVLVDVAVEFQGVRTDDLYPYPLPDLFAGTQLVVAGRYRAGGEATLRLSGKVNNRPQETVYRALSFVRRGGNEFVPRLWAQRKIAHLLTQVRLEGASDALVSEVISVSTRHGVVTPYTSFLVQEPPQAASAPTRAPAVAREQPRIVEKVVEKVVKETVVVEKEKVVEKVVVKESSGEQAVERAVVEKELAEQAHAAAPSAPGQVAQVGDKAFVLREGVWVDTTYDPATMQVVRVAFGSDRYFQLLREQPELGPYLALGQYVVVALGGRAYVISETDQAATGSPAEAVQATDAARTVDQTTAGPGTEPLQGPSYSLWWILLGVGIILLALVVWRVLAVRRGQGRGGS